MKHNFNLIFDFDSTMVCLETLDELAKIVLAGAPDAAERTAKIAAITERGMNGEIGFEQSLSESVWHSLCPANPTCSRCKINYLIQSARHF